jgi:hypothetical protein
MPLTVSIRAAERLELLTSAAKPARPFDEEPAVILANAACCTRSGELIRSLLFGGGGWSVKRSSSEGVGTELERLLPFPLEVRPERRMR